MSGQVASERSRAFSTQGEASSVAGRQAENGPSHLGQPTPSGAAARAWASFRAVPAQSPA